VAVDAAYFVGKVIEFDDFTMMYLSQLVHTFAFLSSLVRFYRAGLSPVQTPMRHARLASKRRGAPVQGVTHRLPLLFGLLGNSGGSSESTTRGRKHYQHKDQGKA
jgi:hypothetical protein